MAFGAKLTLGIAVQCSGEIAVCDIVFTVQETGACVLQPIVRGKIDCLACGCGDQQLRADRDLVFAEITNYSVMSAYFSVFVTTIVHKPV